MKLITQTGLTQAGVVGEHSLQSQTVLPLVSTAFTVAPQGHVWRAITDVVGCHDGTYRSEGSKLTNVSFRQVKEPTCFTLILVNIKFYHIDVNIITRKKKKMRPWPKTLKASTGFYTVIYLKQFGKKSAKLLWNIGCRKHDGDLFQGSWGLKLGVFLLNAILTISRQPKF